MCLRVPFPKPSFLAKLFQADIIVSSNNCNNSLCWTEAFEKSILTMSGSGQDECFLAERDALANTCKPLADRDTIQLSNKKT